MDTKKVGFDFGMGVVPSEIKASENIKPEVVMSAINDIKAISQSFGEKGVSPEEFVKIIDELNSKLKGLGIYLSFEKVGDVPVVRVKDIQGNVIRTFPHEEIAKLLTRIRTFFDVLTEILLSKYA